MTIHWEIRDTMQWSLLLVTITLYIIGVVAIILSKIPIQHRSLSPATASGNYSADTGFHLRLFPNGILYLGAFLHLTILVIRGMRSGHFPVTSIYESLLFFSFVIVVAGFYFSKRSTIPFINVGVIPVAIILLIAALFQIQDVEALAPALRSYWLTIHVGFAFLSYAAYCVAFAAGVFYIFLERQMKQKHFGLLYQLIPPLEVLDEINYFAVALGFVFLTIGIVTGSVWANETWGRYWGWDPKETWSLITWFLYAVLLHVRITSRFRGRKVAYLSILGFGFVIFTYLGVGLLLPGLHSYLAK